VKHWLDYRKVHAGHDHTVVGTVRMLKAVSSPQLGNERALLVYLPPSYRQGVRRYPVLYMHDGQNLFDSATSYAGEWQVDETMQALSAEGLEAIVVGIPNMGRRRVAEYTPFRALHHRTGLGEAYMAFLAETVKPLVDRDFRTLPGRKHTGIMGSSLGGLISLYAFFHCADVYGYAGAMSLAFGPVEAEAFAFVRAAPFTPGKVYMDVGTREAHSGRRETQRMRRDSESYLKSVRAMRDLLVGKGYELGASFHYLEDPGGIHHESAWARRLPGALRFFLGRVHD